MDGSDADAEGDVDGNVGGKASSSLESSATCFCTSFCTIFCTFLHENRTACFGFRDCTFELVTDTVCLNQGSITFAEHTFEVRRIPFRWTL